VSTATVALAWVLSNPVFSASIVGATKPRHLAYAAALDIQLTNEETQSLREPCTPREPTYFLLLTRTALRRSSCDSSRRSGPGMALPSPWLSPALTKETTTAKKPLK
jgi:hypothetical protein